MSKSRIKASSWHPTTNNQSHKNHIQTRPFPVENQNPKTSQQSLDCPGLKPGSMIENINRSIENGYVPRDFPVYNIQRKLKQNLNQAQGEGSPSDKASREKVEPAIGVDFSEAKVHSSSDGNKLNKAIQANSKYQEIKPGSMIENINRSIENGYVPRDFPVYNIQRKLKQNLNQAQGGGSSEGEPFREKVEPAIGADFSEAKVHSSSEEDKLNKAIQANSKYQEIKPGSMIENINRSIENGYVPRDFPLYSIQRKSEPNIQADFEQNLNQAKGGGSPLDKAFREKVEPAMGADFSEVKVHTSSEADKLSQAIQAKAFTTGKDIFFRQGEYEPGSRGGQELLAHELTHVVQQNQGVRAQRVHSQNKGAETQRSDEQLSPATIQQKPNTNSAKLTATKNIIQQVSDEAENIIPEPITLTWAGDQFQIQFERQGNRFEVIVRYQGSHPTDGPFIEDNSTRLEIDIGSKLLNATIRNQTTSSVEVDLYGDRTRIIRLRNTVEFDSRPDSRGRIHNLALQVNGESRYLTSLWVLDPNAKASDFEPIEPEPSPGENPVSKVTDEGIEILIDGDGDQHKELMLRFQLLGTDSNNNRNLVNLQVIQRSSQQMRELTFTLPSSNGKFSLFPIVREVTDGREPTKISLSIPIDNQILEIHPPEQIETELTYTINPPVLYPSNNSEGAEIQISVQAVTFPIEQNQGNEIAVIDQTQAIANIGSLDMSLGAYGDQFRLTFEVKPEKKAILGISALQGGEVRGGLGKEVSTENIPYSSTPGHYIWNPLEISPISLAIDLNEDGEPDIEVYDQLTTPENYDEGGPPESNRNHQIRVIGPEIGEHIFYFQVRDGFLLPQQGRGEASLEAAMNAQAVPALVEQSQEGSFTQQLDAYEGALMAQRWTAANEGLIEQETYRAWVKLSSAIIRVRPQIPEGVEPALQAEAAESAEAFYQALTQETRSETEPVGFGAIGGATTLRNPYTDELTVISAFSSTTSGAGLDLSQDITESNWNKALAKYSRLAFGFDQWILKQLKEVKGEQAPETQRGNLLAGRSKALRDIEQYNPKPVLAVFHPDSQFQEEQGYVSTIPLLLYYWQEGNTWHLKDITNPDRPFHYTTDSNANQQEPPKALLEQLDNPDHFPVGLIHYDIPNSHQGEIRTTNPLTWKKFLSYLGLGLAGVGLTLATFGTGTVAVAGLWALAGSAIASGTSSAINLADGIKHDNLESTTVILDVANIVASLAGVSILAAGRIVGSARVAAATGQPLAGRAAQIAVLADRFYIPVVATNIGADAVSFVTFTVDAAKQLDQIEKGPGSKSEKDRAKALLLSQLAVTGGLLVLSVKGDLPDIRGGRALELHVPADGGPPVATIRGTSFSDVGGVRGNDVYSPNAYTAADGSTRISNLNLEQLEKGIKPLGRTQFRHGASVIPDASDFTIEVPHRSGNITVSVVAEALPTDKLRAAHAHGSDVGPVRLDLRHSGTTSPGWTATIQIDSSVRPEDVKHILGHEVNEIADIVYRNPGGPPPGGFQAQMEANLFRNAGSGTPPTSHDYASAHEIVGLHKDLTNLNNLDKIAYRQETFDGRFSEMGLDQTDNLDLKLRLLQEADAPPELIEMVELVGSRSQRQAHIIDQLRAGHSDKTIFDENVVRHLMFPKKRGRFIQDGIDGGHHTQRLLDFVQNHPTYVVVEEASKSVGGTTFRRYTQYRWNGSGPKPQPGDGNFIGGASYNASDWDVSTKPKTTADDLSVFLREAEDAWRTWLPKHDGSPGSIDNIARTKSEFGGVNGIPPAISANGIEFSGFFDYTPPNTWQLNTIFIEASWLP